MIDLESATPARGVYSQEVLEQTTQSLEQRYSNNEAHDHMQISQPLSKF
jgi:chemotaxis methyl-accepting protein methylase